MKSTLALGLLLVTALHAMPEQKLNTRTQDKVIPLLETLSYEELREKLSKQT